MLTHRQRIAAALLGIGIVALAVRIPAFGDSIAGDELVTYFEVTDHGPRRLLELVRSDLEVTPPLFPVLVEATSQLTDQLRWVSLIAALASLPLTFALGMRTVGARAALVGCAVMALSPFLIFFSTEARPYALMMALCLVSSLSLLRAVQEDRRRWWVLFAVATCAAMYTHYTAAFVLGAQAAWALAAHPGAWRRLLIATAGAAVAYLPWLPSYRTDQGSPGASLISVLHPFDAGVVREDVLRWSIGHPAAETVQTMPGLPAVVLIAAGIAVGVIATAASLVRVRPSLRQALAHPASLLVVLALATPVLAAAYSAVDVSVYLPRNLIASTPALALLIGALTTSARTRWIWVPATTMVLAGYAIGAAKTLPSSAHRPDYDGAARFIEERPNDRAVVVDVPGATAGPLSQLDVALAGDGARPVLRLGRASRAAQLSAFRSGGPGQYTPLPVPSPKAIANQAVRRSEGTILLVAPGAGSFDRLRGRAGDPRTRALFAASAAAQFLKALPAGFRHRGTRTFPGVFSRQAISVYVLKD